MSSLNKLLVFCSAIIVFLSIFVVAEYKDPNLNYVISGCKLTLYPQVCFRTISRYAAQIQRNPARLATVAMAISLSHTRNVSVYLSRRQSGYRTSERYAASALSDCCSNLRDAVDQIAGSIKEMRMQKTTGYDDEFRFQMSNAQTWMSSALTDQETCTDGFQDVRGGSLKADVVGRVEAIKRLTSNALALLNSYASKRRN